MESKQKYYTKSEPLEFAKIPPQAIDLEEAVLGAILLEKNAINEVSEILKPEYFYKPAHEVIYIAITKMHAKNQPLDILSVTEYLRKSGEIESVGGAYFVASLTNRVGSTANIEFHARVIAEKAIKRKVIEFAGNMLNKAYDDTVDTFDLLDESEIGIKNISNVVPSGGVEHVFEPMDRVLNQYMEAKNNPDRPIGQRLFIPGYDEIAGNAMPGDLIIIGARPSMGKTMLSVHISKEMAKNGNKGLFYSLEMTKELLVSRLVCSEAAINSQDLREGKLSVEEENRFAQAKIVVDELPLYFDDSTYDIHKIISTARKFKATHQDLGFIAIDYLQKITGSDPDNRNANRDIQIGYFTGALKRLAKELKIPVIVLAQVGRSTEKGGRGLFDLIPNLSELRESGNIEQDADIVAFPFRPAYYGHLIDEEGNDIANDFWIAIRKNRNGSVGIGKAECDLLTQRIFPKQTKISSFAGYGEVF